MSQRDDRKSAFRKARTLTSMSSGTKASEPSRPGSADQHLWVPKTEMDEDCHPPLSPRAQAREAAFQILFHWDVNPEFNFGQVERFLRESVRDESAADFARELVRGVMELKDRLDEQIQAVSENWAVSRMSVTDRTVLRLGAYELLYTETPGEVVIDQAVELAKRFGTAQSGAFVNGILDRLMHGCDGLGGKSRSHLSAGKGLASPGSPGSAGQSGDVAGGKHTSGT